MRISINKRPPFVKNILFAEGISRSGKLLLADLLACLEDVEPIQYYGLLEHVPFWVKFGIMKKDLAKELIKCEIDTHCYEMLIGRNLNYRIFDKSSIFKKPGYKKYIERSKQKDTDNIINSYYLI